MSTDDRPELEGLTAEDREILEFLLQQEEEQAAAVQEIEHQVDRFDLPLSFAQERLWVVDQMSPESSAYNVPLDVTLDGPLDVCALEQTLSEIVRRHEPLRTSFTATGDRPRQIIRDEGSPRVRLVDLSGLAKDAQAETARLLSVEETSRGFDLANELLLRSTLLRFGPENHRAVTTLHHVASDGWSLGVMSRELGVLYGSYAGGGVSPLADLRVQYGDYAVWHRALLGGGALEAQGSYWEAKLRGAPEVMALPTDRVRPVAPTNEGGLYTFEVDGGLTEGLDGLSRTTDVTLFMTLMAAYEVLLSRYTGETDLCIGTDVANRSHADTEALIGFFVNQLVIRGDVSGEPTVAELLGRVRETMLEAYAHQDLPFEQLVKRLNPDRDRGVTPLFQVKFVLNNTPMEAFELSGLRLTPMEAEVGGAKFDLLLNMIRTADGLRGTLEYSRDLFDASTIERMAGHFERLLKGMVASPDATIGSLAMLTEAERRSQVEEFNATDAAVDGQTLAERFEAQVARDPDAAAVVSGAETVTYGELNRRANQVAHTLRARGVGPDVTVGLYVERSVEMVVGLLGVTKAGGAYVPLDPSYPSSRLSYVLEDADPAVVLTTDALAGDVELPADRVLNLEGGWPEFGQAATTNPVVVGSPENLVYLIYTSGSTGHPKGTMLTQAGLANYLTWASAYYGVEEGEAPVVHSPLGFDLTVTSLLTPLVTGQAIELLASDVALDDLGSELLARRDMSLLKVTPSHLAVLRHQVGEADAGALSRVLIVGGDQLTTETTGWWREHAPDMRIINEYGPTEAVVGCCVHEMEADGTYGGAVPIGRPIANTQLYVQDVGGSLVADGVSGELTIGGAGVARGYLGRADLTADRFVPDAYGRTAGARVYRTGDVVRRRGSVGLEYQGRVDHQVKIRGYRIELGEIEAVLGEHGGVDQAVVVTREDGAGGRQMVAYVEGPTETGVSELRDHLLGRVPEYMVPSVFVWMAALPLTENGKVDRRALPDVDESRLEVETGHVAPRTEVERTLAGLWEEFLEVEDVGVHDNFFELGGDSIQSLQIVAQCIGAGLMLTSQQLFEYPTIAGLAALLEGDDEVADDEIGVPPIERVDHDGPIPLSFAQERLWFLDQLEPGQSVYNIPAAVKMLGPLRLDALQQTFGDLARRHEVLRTTFSSGASGPTQSVGSNVQFSMPVIDLQGIEREEADAICLRLATEEAGRPFDLSTGPMLRATVLRLSPTEHVVLFVMHHVVGDGWSMGILVEELSRGYQSAAAGTAPVLPELAVQYTDFAAWQREWFVGDRLAEQLDYWTERLGGAPPALELPTDRPRPPVQSFRGARRSFMIGDGIPEALRELNQSEGTTTYMALLAAFQVLLHRWTGREDILVGSPIAGRERTETQDLIGFFVNTLVMRASVSPQMSFRELLQETREVATGAYRNQDLPFEKIVDELDVERDLSRSPLFQVMFVFENAPEPEWSTSEITMESLVTETGIAKFDLMLDMAETEDGLKAAFDYNTDLFDAETIDRMVLHFVELIRGVTRSPDRPVGELNLLPREERRTLLVDWNDTAVTYPSEGPIHRMFEAQVERAPDAIALATRSRQLTYRRLNAEANRLSRHLSAMGVGPEVRVALCLERSADVLVAILAVLKAGGTYVPLDPEYPAARVAFIVGDSRASVMVTQTDLLDRLPEYDAQTLCIDAERDAIATHSAEDRSWSVGPECLSHVIYTSGSTGLPKGVAIEHRSVATLIQWSREHYSDTDLHGVLASTSVCFDLSLWEFFVPLSWGGTVVLAENALALPGHPEVDRVTLVNTVPSAISELLRQNAVLATVEVVNLAGEPLTTRLADAIYDLGTVRRVCDLYGPSEDTTYSTYAQRVEGGVATIGAPVANTRAYMLGSAHEPTPIGVPGELHLGGSGLARGYLDRADLTAERFVPDPFAGEPGDRVYRTGDLVRWCADGSMEFLGRIDHQVKIRGFRIELGEIQAVLASDPTVQDAVVTASDDGRGGKRLVAYVTGETGLPDDAALRVRTQERLPTYMVPSVIMCLDELPRTPNGKLDRSRLPEPGDAAAHGQHDFVDATTSEEIALTGIWCDVLGVERVGVHDNFFQLGGDSILSIQIISRAREVGLELTPKDLFERQSIAELAQVAGAASAFTVDQGPVTGLVPITPIQHWFLDRDTPTPSHFNQAVLLEVSEPLDVDALERAVDVLVAHHDALRHRFVRTEKGWSQEGVSHDASWTFVTASDLPGDSERAWVESLQAALAELHGSLDLAEGPLVRVGLFEAGDDYRRLAVVIHHLVVDGVSWRILLEDLQTAYGQAVANESITLPRKTTSFAEWAERMSGQEGLRATSEGDYWGAVLGNDLAPLPVDGEASTNPVSGVRLHTVELELEETEALLRDVPEAYRTRIDDVLLTAMGQSLGRWVGGDVLVDVEGHGRDTREPDVDLSRTVGWFTTMYPVVLTSRSETEELGEHLMRMKESLRAVPDGGRGYGVLRYGSEPSRDLAARPAAQVTFNYLGQFDQALPDDSAFGWAAESSGPAQADDASRSHLLDISGVVVGGVLRVSFQYGSGVHDAGTIEAVAQAFVESLRELITHCRTPEAGGRTPSDFPLATMNQAMLDQVMGADRRLDDLYPLSPMQSGLLFHTLSDPDSGVYFEQFNCVLEGSLNEEAFRAAWQGVVDRHSVLRTCIRLENPEQPLQAVLSSVELPWTAQDWRARSPEDQHRDLADFLEEDRARGFDLSVAPLMRIALIRLTDDQYRFVWSHHHLLLDGWSIPILMKEVLALYEAQVAGTTPQLGSAAPYRNYIGWIRAQDLGAAETFWRDVLDGFSSPTTLGVEAPGQLSSSQETHGSRRIELPAGASDRLRSMARDRQLTLNTLFQGAWSLILGRYSGDTDVVFGATVAGRPPELAGVESMVGLFINTVPVRTSIRDEQVVESWLDGLQGAQVTARSFEYSPLGEVQTWSDVPAGTPLFESILVFENYPVDEELRGESALVVRDAEVAEQTNYPLTVVVVPGSKLSVRIDYDATRFDGETVARMLDHLETALTYMTDSPAGLLGGLDLTQGEERTRLLTTWNETERALSSSDLVHDRIVARARQASDTVAVRADGAALTYRELDERSGQLASSLRARGVGPDVLVGVCMDRSVELAVALLGILRSGGAFLPLDPSFPDGRLEYMLTDTGVDVVLTSSAVRDRIGGLAGGGTSILSLDTEWESVAGQASIPPDPGLHDANTAYVIYTSGSTGRPKGTMIPHRGIANYLDWCVDLYAVEAGAGAQVHSSIGFDLTITSLLAPLMAGRPVEMVVSDHGVGRLVSHVTREKGSSFLKVTPAHLELLSQSISRPAAEGITNVLVVGGEALQSQATAFWRTHAPDTRIINEYGPTEAVVGCCVYELSAEGHTVGSVPIGRPVANTRLYSVDRSGHPAPIGVAGELLIGGDQLARGYLGRPDLTAESFLPDGVSGRSGERLYSTGDLARWSHEGQLDFLGRRDHQVKIRGHRIELGEIESVLAEHAEVAEVAVVVREDRPGVKRLVAYLSAGAGTVPATADLRAYLGSRLPDYMVPAVFMWLDVLPLAASGKVDRRALPAPDEARPELEEAYADPTTAKEEALAEIWATVLGVDRVGVHDNFFQLGGDSILAMQIVVRGNQAGLELTPRQLFEHQTVAELAAVAGSGVAIQAEQGLVTGSVPLSPIQRWFFEEDFTDPHYYNQSVFLQARDTLHVPSLERAVEALLGHHDTLRLRFRQDGETWVQEGGGVGGEIPVSHVDLTALPASDRPRELERLSQQVQGSLNLSDGPIVRVVQFDVGGEWSGRLLLAVHHLVIDGVSWRILLEDLQSAYAAAVAGEEISLPRKTTSFAHWAERAIDLASQDNVTGQMDHWRSFASGASSPLPLDHPDGVNTVASRQTVTTSLAIEETEALLREVPHAYRTQINDVLLAALADAFARWTGESALVLDLEGHGRDVELDDVDLSRTVGWFTSTFPVRVEWDRRGDLGAALTGIKERLRSIPSNGIGYGILRYLGDDSVTDILRAGRDPEIAFNYLGQFDQALGSDSAFAVAPEATGDTQSGRAKRTHVLDVTGLVSEGRLKVSFQYSENLHRRATVEQFAQHFVDALRGIIEHCLSPDAGGASPSDFPLADVDQATLDRLMEEMDL